MRFVVLDESTDVGNAPAFGGVIAPATLARMAAAHNVQLNRDFASRWAGAYAVRAGASKLDIGEGEYVAAFVDALPDAPGAVAYHDRDGRAVPFILLARTQCSSITSGAGSVAAALSHELLELAGDPYCNAWRDNGKGGEYAQEMCDAVQEGTYEIDGIAVSNFLFPAFFAPDAAGPYDYLGQIARPLQTAPGGYQIYRNAGGGETQVFGAIGPHRLAKKRHFSSRTFRRGVRL